MSREELLEKVKHCVPDLGWDSKYPDLYGKYGVTICGICDGWRWFTEENVTDIARQHGHRPLTDATDIELLTMWAMADSYWLDNYKGWFKKAEEKSARLDRFIGTCEMRYFGYDEDGYTHKTIDRVLDSVLEILDSHFEDTKS